MTENASTSEIRSAGSAYIIVSLVLAVVTFSFQWMMAGHAPLWLDVPYQTWVAGAFISQFAWIASVITAFVKLRKSGWPVLLGAPMALLWLYIVVVLSIACRNGAQACMS